MTMSRRKWKRLLLLFIVAVSLVTVIRFIWFAFRPVGLTDVTVTVEIPKGSGFLKIVDMLDEKGLVRNKPFFYTLSLIKGAARVIRAGEYEFTGNMSPIEILDKLVKGNIKFYMVTIKEDTTLREIASQLAELKLVKKEEFLKAAYDKAFLATLHIDGESVEGYLYPETYRLDRTMGEREIIRIMVDQFWRKFTPDLQKRAIEMNMTIGEVVTLASLIGKETGLKEEKALISAVFHNRLKKGMKLQCDPTAIYNVSGVSGPIKKSHLKLNHRYNTYMIEGLPPGPIANPDIDSIRAALYPAKVDYLYFVSNNDGSHVFSANFSDHSKAILSYRLKKKKD
ncbi:MAG: endolytic transglycosylase MltG [Syntrophales bacterium]|nr:endolytic transglycosylase MltG [Syntrophales bacterium]